MNEHNATRNRYPKGCRVRATEQFRQTFRGHPEQSYFGVVVGYGALDPEHIRVRRDGQKTPVTYHVWFWEPDAPLPAPLPATA